MQDAAPIAELDHAAHDRRQYEQCAPATLQRAAAKLSPGHNARWIDGQWQPLAYPGFAFQAMADADARNHATIDHLSRLRDALVETASTPGRLYPLPKASFHQTVINTFSADRLERHVIQPGLLARFPQLLADGLIEFDAPARSDTAQMSLIGLSLFRTAIGALGVFPDARHYARVLAARSRAYDSPTLNEMGLTRTRPFIAHITLAYLEAAPSPGEQQALLERVLGLNSELARHPLPYFMPAATLCAYEHLSAYTPHAVNLSIAI